MTAHALSRRARRSARLTIELSNHWTWLAGGFVLAFAVPFLLEDVFRINRDLFYGVYAVATLTLLSSWARATRYGLAAALTRRWRLAGGLGLAFAGIMAWMAVRTEHATARPGGVELVAAVIWRGIVYGAMDGLLLSVFPILVVFAAFARSPLRDRLAGRVAIGVAALVASVAMTAVYHAGYSDFRSGKLAKPLSGDVVWSMPTLVTLNPIGAPIAHAGLHISAVLHSYDTNTFLPPHS